MNVFFTNTKLMGMTLKVKKKNFFFTLSRVFRKKKLMTKRAGSSYCKSTDTFFLGSV